MTKHYYYKMAMNNINKNAKTYRPYSIASVLAIAMFYVISAIAQNKGLDDMISPQTIKTLLLLGSYVIAIFIGIFLFYTNSFLIKQRRKELGLYNVLGLGKKHIRRMLLHEMLIQSARILLLGILVGIVFNKGIFLVLLKIVNFPVQLGFDVSKKAIILSVILYLIIQSASYIYNVVHVSLMKPVELLKGGNVGEKEPKTKWLIALIGIASLSAGYAKALSVESPMEAIGSFFPAVLLVMIGTYGIFCATSIVVFKLLRKNKHFYYKTENFITVSNMIYRMKQNAVGLANICILSTAVLVMLSTTASLYVGIEDVIRTRYPRQVVINGNIRDENQVNQMEQIISDQLMASDLSIENKLYYTALPIECFGGDGNYRLVDVTSYNYNDVTIFQAIGIEDYNRVEEVNESLDEDQIILMTPSRYQEEDKIEIQNHEFEIVKTNRDKFADIKDTSMGDSITLIVRDVEAFREKIGLDDYLEYNVMFDMNGSDEEIIAYTWRLDNQLQANGFICKIENAPQDNGEIYGMYGSLLFLGIFIGTLFLMATVMIIYYKQVNEGIDDQKRFAIMKSVGLSKREILGTIKQQIRIVFFLPLVFAIIHIGFAYPIMVKMLQALNLYNTKLFMVMTLITIGVFTVIYWLVYQITAKTYYNIVDKGALTD